jgi:hypothetical protein
VKTSDFGLLFTVCISFMGRGVHTYPFVHHLSVFVHSHALRTSSKCSCKQSCREAHQHAKSLTQSQNLRLREDVELSLNMLIQAAQKQQLGIALVSFRSTLQRACRQVQKVILVAILPSSRTNPTRPCQLPQFIPLNRTPFRRNIMCEYTLIFYTCAHKSRKGIDWCPDSRTLRSFGLCPKAQSDTIEVRFGEECDACLIWNHREARSRDEEKRKDEGRQ